MERVAFLIEKTGESISCLLNPESLVARRRAGVDTLHGTTGKITGTGRSDDPIAGTGGGITEYELDLLFDVDLAGEETAAAAPRTAAFEAAPAGPPGPEAPVAAEPARPAAEPTGIDAIGAGATASGTAETLLIPARRVSRDVRELTRPFWALSENAPDGDGYGAPPIVRMIWGRAWNVLGVVVAAAERLERFSDAGVPSRSWLRLRLRRVSEAPAAPTAVPEPVTPQFELPPVGTGPGGEGEAIAIAVAPDGLPIDRLDQIAADVLGDPEAWRLIAAANDIDDPLNLAEGTVLQLPPGTGPA